MDLAFLSNYLLVNIRLSLQIKALAVDSQEHPALGGFLECPTEEHLQAGIHRQGKVFPHMQRLVASTLKHLGKFHNSSKVERIHNHLSKL